MLTSGMIRKQCLANGIGVLEGSTSRNASGTGMLGSTRWPCKFSGQNFEVEHLAWSCSVVWAGYTRFLFWHFDDFCFFWSFLVVLRLGIVFGVFRGILSAKKEILLEQSNVSFSFVN